jgi:hypothetical protein
VDEDALSCPPAPTAGCDKVCRAAACEELVLARKARRIFYLDDVCPAPRFPPIEDPDNPGEFISSDPCLNFGFDDPRFVYPHPTGPVVAFWVAAIPILTETGYDYALTPGAFMQFTSTSGLAPTSRRPLSNGSAVGAALPNDVVPFDRSTIPGREEDGLRFYVSYPDNQVLVFRPHGSASDTSLIR